MKKKIKRQRYDILYWIRMIGTVVYLSLLFFLLPNILNSGWQGHSFLFLSLLLIGLSLYSSIKKNHATREKIAYNLIYIGLIAYLCLIFGRLFFDDRVKMTMIYQVDMAYFQNNYFILSFVLVGIILYTLLFLWDEKNVK